MLSFLIFLRADVVWDVVILFSLGSRDLLFEIVFPFWGLGALEGVVGFEVG